jgi:hypothetical protein
VPDTSSKARRRSCVAGIHAGALAQTGDRIVATSRAEQRVREIHARVEEARVGGEHLV